VSTKATSQSFGDLDTSANYRYVVTAENKAGKGQASPQSNAVMPYGTPTVPPRPTARLLNDTDRKAEVSWGATADFRGPGGYYRVRATDGQGNVVGPRTATSPYVFTGLVNGRNYTFTVRACNDYKCSEWSQPSNAVSPYTVPGTPGVTWHKTSATDGHFTVRGTGNDGGRPVQNIEWKMSGSQTKDGSRSAGQGWPFDVGVSGGYSQSYTLQARACNAAGCGAWARASGQTDPPPDPRAWVTKGGNPGSVRGCESGTCNYFVVNTKDFPAGNHQVQCWSDSTPQVSGWHDIITGGKTWSAGSSKTYSLPANGQVQLSCFFGYPGVQVAVMIDGKRYEARTW
jgi:hypothetical protein